MNRRAFFKFLAATVAVSAVPAIAKVIPPVAEIGRYDSFRFIETSSISDFLAGKEFGMSVMLPGGWKQYGEWTKDFLIENAREHLPAGTVVEIRVGVPTDFGREQGAAWYTNQRIGYADDPLNFVRWVFDWDHDQLKDSDGPDVWQADILTEIGNYAKTIARGENPGPLQLAVASVVTELGSLR
jgi:hypothetical protein